MFSEPSFYPPAPLLQAPLLQAPFLVAIVKCSKIPEINGCKVARAFHLNLPTLAHFETWKLL